MTQKQQQNAGAKVRPRYVTPDKVRTLKCDATVAQDAYILAALRLLAHFGTLRAQTVGRAVFCGRSAVAAHAAAKRTLKACVERNLVEARRKPGTQHFYYALTRAGALHLNERAPLSFAATSGHALLTGDMVKAVHREWTSVIAITAAQRKSLISVGELEIQRDPGNVSSTLVDERFKGQHVPDVLTFYRDNMVVVWHEVELSRRNHWGETTQRRKDAAERARAKKAGVNPRVMRSGRDQFVHLMRTLRQAYVLRRGDGEYRLLFVAHCASELIRSELSRLFEQAFSPRECDGHFRPELEILTAGLHYRVNYENGEPYHFDIYLQMLPCEDPANAPVHCQELLWIDAPHDPRDAPLSHKFIAKPYRQKRKR